ncbi:uncharacterized protein LOC119148417 [Falco rusticolus]|uniref:uncharacterized protein LOC119148417 n=1 Tax=Falco rusticolus TaxID=120794 RepID=UPI0018869F32|nr:uncharacterized protein LOC119148417 [Falco rusticolus]
MSFLLFAVTALHVLVLVLLFVATLDKAWWVLPDEETVNLWYDCVLQNSTRSWVCASVADSRADGGGPAPLQCCLRALRVAAAHGAPRAPLLRLGGHPAPGSPCCCPAARLAAPNWGNDTTAGITNGVSVASDVISRTNVADGITDGVNVASDVINRTSVANGVSVASDIINQTNMADGVASGVNVANDVINQTNMGSDISSRTNMADDIANGVSVASGAINRTNMANGVNVASDIINQINVAAGITNGVNMASDIISGTNMADSIASDITNGTSMADGIATDTTKAMAVPGPTPT